MKRSMLAVVLVISGLTLTQGTSAQMAQSIDDVLSWSGGKSGDEIKIGMLIAKHSEKCLSVKEISKKSGAAVIQWWCDPNAASKNRSQLWRLWKKERMSNTEAIVEVSAAHSQHCLDVANAGKDNGVPLIQSSCHGGNNQQWRITYIGDGYFRLAAEHSGKCLSVKDISKENGAQVIQWWCDPAGNPAQVWRFEMKEHQSPME